MPKFVINHFRRNGKGWKADRTVLPDGYQNIAEALLYAKEDANLALRYDYHRNDHVGYEADTRCYVIANARGKVLERWQIFRDGQAI